jgi:excinuclease ABC subunit A
VPVRGAAEGDQDFVINGEKKNGEYEEDEDSGRWYGVRGFFKWLESKTYKMHVRVLLSRYRAYTTCPSCSGGRFQPEALNYRLVTPPPSETNGKWLETALTLPALAQVPVGRARDLLANLALAA